MKRLFIFVAALLVSALSVLRYALRKAGAPITPETFKCPYCGGTLPLGTDKCEYRGQTMIT